MTSRTANRSWKVLSSKTGYNHPFLKVREDEVELPNGRIIPDFSVWENGDVSQVLAVTAHKKIVLVKLYKHAAGKEIIECPGGYIDQGEDPMVAARRELEEETGFTAARFERVSAFRHHPTKETGITHFFLALDAQQVHGGRQEETEGIEVLSLELKEVLELIDAGEIEQSGTLVGVLTAIRKLGEDFFENPKQPTPPPAEKSTAP